MPIAPVFPAFRPALVIRAVDFRLSVRDLPSHSLLSDSAQRP